MKNLVLYFSVYETTKAVATEIAKQTGADLVAIEPVKPYDGDRSHYNALARYAKKEHDENMRPAIKNKIDISGYDNIFIGYPIWFGEEPRIMDTFVESYDFGDATVIPFCTSGSSDIGSSGTNLAANAGSGNWLEGKRFDGDVSEDELTEWIESLGL